MLKIEVVQNFIDPNEELNKEKCLLYIHKINDVLKQSRANIYHLFLGEKSFKFAVILILISTLLYIIFKAQFILTFTLFEIIGYFILSVLLSEYLNKKLKESLLLQKQYFKEALEKLSS